MTWNLQIISNYLYKPTEHFSKYDITHNASLNKQQGDSVLWDTSFNPKHLC